VLSLSVVPVGLTRYNLDRPIRLLTAAEAAKVVQQIERARERAQTERGLGWAYAADELFFIAGQPLPEDGYYDDWPLTENGVGAVRRLLDDFEANLEQLPRRSGSRIGIITGTRMEPVFNALRARLAQQLDADIQIIGVTNRYFGETVSTAGLLPGADIAHALGSSAGFDLALLPAEALNDDQLFVDNLSLSALRARFPHTRLEPAFALTTALREL
jgi:NifB/MoaA-like Fe-S oxidoreductase